MPTRAIVILIAFAAALFACGPDWREHRSAAGKFAVRFPGTNLVTREVNDLRVTFHIVSLTVSDTMAYGVSWYDIAEPDKPAADILLEVQAKALRSLNAGLERAGEIRLGDRADGAPGRAFVARAASGVYVSVRVYAVGAKPLRIYQLTAAVPDPGPAEADIKRFFDSFKLVD
jgi:hypothetical protein